MPPSDVVDLSTKAPSETRRLAKQHLPLTSHDGQATDDALWRTLIEDYDGFSYPAKSTLSNVIKLLRIITKVGDPSKTKDIMKMLTPWDELHVNRILTALRRKSFAITEKVNMAMAPPGTKPGDVIAVFLGSAFPQVPRRREGGYAHWGEADVHWILKDEVLNERQEWR